MGRAGSSAIGQVRPEVLNADQGSQFASLEFTQVIKGRGVRINMNGNGLYSDDFLVERLCRTVKCEEVCLKAYAIVLETSGGWKTTSGSKMRSGRIRPWATGIRPSRSMRSRKP